MQVPRPRRHAHSDRISPLDLSNLRVEERGMPMHIAALALVDARPLLDDVGGLRIEEVRRLVDDRIRNVPRLHQVLDWSRGRHRAPVWEVDRGFAIGDHVLTRTLPRPGDEQTLLRVCADLNAAPLDRSRPLWELWLLDGLVDDRVALLLRLHHVIADGIAALELLSSLFDEAPRPPQEPSPVARDTDIATAAVLRAQQGWAVVRGGRAPALSWNRPVGSRRVHLFVRGDLADAKAVAHRRGGKVNDVVLAAVAGGAHRLLESRGELTSGLDMHVSVAASIRRPGETGGNRVGIRLVRVPIGDPDALSRLRTIAARTAAQRDRPPLQPSGRLLQRWTVHVMAHQRLTNLILSNMPGPPLPLRFADARIQEMFQLGVLQGNCAIGVSVLSYAGQLNADVVADPDVVPDVEVFAQGVAEALEQLGAARTART